MRRGFAAAVLAGGLFGAAADLWVACTLTGLPLMRIGKAVARGWFGKAARDGGTDVALIGLVSHFAIVLVFAGVFVAASIRMPILRRLWFLAGPVYGAGIFLRHALRDAPPLGRRLLDAEAAGALVGDRRPPVPRRLADRRRGAISHAGRGRSILKNALGVAKPMSRSSWRTMPMRSSTRCEP